jgi:fucose 4-O-acetylase-like acetyltransferase
MIRLGVTSIEVKKQEARVRAWQLDAVRGLAIVLMVGDHVSRQLEFGYVYSYTLGRVAMPLFFVLAGHLFSRLNWRHAAVGCVGLVVPLAVPWIDSPNVLVWWALGCVMLAACRWGGVSPWLLVLVGLTLFANGWGELSGSYPPAALYALMGVGALLKRESWRWAERLPRWLAALGRAPVRWYVGHLIALQAVIYWAAG